MITIKTESIYGRDDWYQAQCVIGKKTYTIHASTRDLAVRFLLEQMEKDGLIK